MYKEKLVKLIIKGVIGIIIGTALFFFTMPDSGFFSAIIMGLFFAGLPSGWEISGKVVGGIMVIGNPAVMIFSFLLRLIISILIGWIAYPIMLIYTIIKTIKG